MEAQQVLNSDNCRYNDRTAYRAISIFLEFILP
jgi:hypothetical protein